MITKRSFTNYVLLTIQKPDWENKNYSNMDKRDAINITTKYANAVKLKYDLVSIIRFGSYAKNNFNGDSDIDIAVILKDYNNLIDIQLDLTRLRRKIESRIEPHPIRERDFDITNPVVNEIVQYGQDINVNGA